MHCHYLSEESGTIAFVVPLCLRLRSVLFVSVSALGLRTPCNQVLGAFGLAGTSISGFLQQQSIFEFAHSVDHPKLQTIADQGDQKIRPESHLIVLQRKNVNIFCCCR